MNTGECVLSDILNFMVFVCAVVDVCRWSRLTRVGGWPGVMACYENGDWLELWRVQLVLNSDSILLVVFCLGFGFSSSSLEMRCVNQCLRRKIVIADCIWVVTGVNFGNGRVARPWDFLCNYVSQCVVSVLFCLDLACICYIWLVNCWSGPFLACLVFLSLFGYFVYLIFL